MGQGQSGEGTAVDKKAAGSKGNASQKQQTDKSYTYFKNYLDEQYPKALERVKDDLPFIKQAYDHITKTDKIQEQQHKFCKLLFQQRIWNNDETYVSREQLDALATTIFMCYIPQDQGTMQFEHFLCMYATLTCPESDEESFYLVFRVYCMNPPEFDEESQEYYVWAGRFQSRGMNLFGIDRSHASDFFRQSLNIFEDLKVHYSNINLN